MTKLESSSTAAPALQHRQPVTNPELLPLPLEPDSSEQLPLSFYLSLLRRYRWAVLTSIAFVTLGVALVSSLLHKRYQATAILRIDPSNISALGDNAAAERMQLSALGLLTTAAKEVKSPAVILRTIAALHLDQNPDFAPRHPNPGTTHDALMNGIVGHVRNNISVTQPTNSYLLLVSFRSRDPQLSASIANSLLQSLIQQDYKTRVRALTALARSMQAQLVSMRAKMERSQKALVNYESQNDILDPSSSNNIMQSRLSQVSTDLDQAENKRIALQADYQIVQRGNLNALLASDQGKYLRPLFSRLQAEQQRLQQMLLVMGPQFPPYRLQSAVVAHLQTALKTQQLNLANQIRSQYRMAQAAEDLLKHELARQKHNMDRFNLKAVRFYTLKSAAQTYTKLYYQLERNIQDASTAANLHGESLRVFSPARPIYAPVYPRPMLAALIALLLSSLVSIGTVLTIGVMDNRVSTPEQVENWFNLPVLSTIPQFTPQEASHLLSIPLNSGTGLAKPNGNISSFQESIWSLQNALLLIQGRDVHTLVISSATPGEGKSTVTVNLAVSLAKTGKQVLLVDADMRKPTVHLHFGIPNRCGLSTVLLRRCGLDQALQTLPQFPGLTVLTSGSTPSNSSELLHVGLSELLDSLRQRFDIILFDCPPVMGIADTLAIVNLVDLTLLTVLAGKTERQLVNGALRQLRNAHAQLSGIILNAIPRNLSSYYSYYDKSSNYYRDPESATEVQSEESE